MRSQRSNVDEPLQQEQGPRLEATAQDVAGDVAAIAYSVSRVVPRENGGRHQAFVVRSRDAGATWSCLPLVRTVGSCCRFWGFPVWPPEHIDAVAVEGERVRITFRDGWVPFEPGGESLWTGRRSSGGLWTVQRVRSMDYDGTDSPEPPQPIVVALPPGFRLPPAQLLERIASRLAVDTPSRVVERAAWAPILLVGIGTAVWGAGWWLLAAASVFLVGLPVLAILVERRRHRRTVSRP